MRHRKDGFLASETLKFVAILEVDPNDEFSGVKSAAD